jgi:hypothetical protein
MYKYTLINGDKGICCEAMLEEIRNAGIKYIERINETKEKIQKVMED